VPTSPLRRLWQRATITTRRKLLLGALAVLIAAAAVIAPLILVNQGNQCGAGYFRGALHECIGVSDGGYDFSAALQSVDQDIAQENAWVADHSAQHVTVALLLPLTSADTPTVETVEAVEGAFVAQYRKNHDDNGKQPLVELVLANPGTDSAQWQPVAAQLNGMKSAPANLRAVAGVSVSTTTTQQEVAALTQGDGIPVVGGAIVADDLANALGRTAAYPGLARVEPTNREEAAALAAYGAHNAQPNQVVLVEDTNPTDEYDKTLAAAFANDTNQQVLQYDSQADPQGVSTMANDLQRDVSLICGNPPVKWVYFAGRQDALVDFINELASCQQRQFTVLTGSAASHVVNQQSLSLDAKDFAGGFITLEYVPIASPATWENYPQTGPGWSPNGYQDFAGTFHAKFGDGDGPLVDGQAIINYDAVFTAISGIRLETGGGTGIPSPEAVAGSWSALYEGNAVLGASGEICVDNQGNPWNKVIPIVKYAASGTPQVVAREYPADGGRPVTVPCNIPKNG
jgi:hypothetical protein